MASTGNVNLNQVNVFIENVSTDAGEESLKSPFLRESALSWRLPSPYPESSSLGGTNSAFEERISLLARPGEALSSRASYCEPPDSAIPRPGAFSSIRSLASVDLSRLSLRGLVLGLTASGRWPTPFAKPWLMVRVALFAILSALPWAVFGPANLRPVWFVPVMTTFAVLLPASGVPIAGGIVFFPVLSLAGFRPDSAVAFAAATQAIGVGVFTPLTWYVQEPNVFLRAALPPAVIGSAITCALAVFVWPSPSERITVAVFTIFAAFCAAFTFHGLFCGKLSKARGDVPYTWDAYTYSFLSGLVGGFLVGYIGIGVEKTLFIVLSGLYHTDPKRCGITSITVVGIVSFLNAAYHFFVMRNVPVAAWLFGLQGLLIGSFLGPATHRILGRTVVLTLFGILLLVDVANNCACLMQPDLCKNLATEMTEN